ncbi:MAG: lactonase family protein [Microbacteriaceae bacterium]
MTDWFVGGYTADMGGDAVGIGVLRSKHDGSLENMGSVASVGSPSFLVVSETAVYAAGEGSNLITTFVRGDDLTLSPATAVSAAGTGPCHLGLYGDTLVVSCYSDGTIASLNAMNSTLLSTVESAGSGPRPEQAGPHAHSSAQLIDGRIVSADLGADRIYVHELDGGLLTRVATIHLPAGTGPRDIRVLSSGVVLVIAEFALVMIVYEPDGSGNLREVSTVPLPGAVCGDFAAAIAITPDERFVYSGLRGSNRVSVLELTHSATAPVRATPIGFVSAEGDWPRHLIVDADVLHVANQRSSSVSSFRLTENGIPALIGQPTPVGSPTVLAKA